MMERPGHIVIQDASKMDHRFQSMSLYLSVDSAGVSRFNLRVTDHLKLVSIQWKLREGFNQGVQPFTRYQIAQEDQTQRSA
jgi:hypothetical protein